MAEHGDHRGKSTKERGAAHLVRLVVNSPRATPRPERSSPPGSISGRPPSAMDCDHSMPTGNSRPTSTRTTSPPLCSPRSKAGFYSPRFNAVPVHSKLRSIPSWRSPSTDKRVSTRAAGPGTRQLRPASRSRDSYYYARSSLQSGRLILVRRLPTTTNARSSLSHPILMRSTVHGRASPTLDRPEMLDYRQQPSLANGRGVIRGLVVRVQSGEPGIGWSPRSRQP